MDGSRIITVCAVVSALAAALTVPWNSYFPKADPVRLVASVPPPQDAGEPSFDCRKSVTWAEVTICANDRLIGLDHRLDRKFYSIYNDIGRSDKIRLKAAQKDWISHMDECQKYGDGVDCLIRKYATRLQELDGIGS